MAMMLVYLGIRCVRDTNSVSYANLTSSLRGVNRNTLLL